MNLRNMEQVPLSGELDEVIGATLRTMERKQHIKRRNRVLISLCSAAAAVLLGVLLFRTVPAFASGVRFIGSLFSKQQGAFAMPEDIAEKADTLNEVPESIAEDGSVALPTAEEYIKGLQYACADRGVAIVPSEIYSDGISVFVSAELYFEKPLTEMAGSADAVSVDSVQTNILYALDGAGLQNENDRGLYAGQAWRIDEYRIACVLKANLDGSITDHAEHRLGLRMSKIDVYMQDSGGRLVKARHEGGPSFRITGSWKMELPFTADAAKNRIFTDLDGDGAACGMEKVTVTPYQIQVLYTPVNTYIASCVLDENGHPLERWRDNAENGNEVFALSGKSPSKLTVYLYDTSYEVLRDGTVVNGWSCAEIMDPWKAEHLMIRKLELDLSE